MKQYARNMFIKLLIMEKPMTRGPCIFSVQLNLLIMKFRRRGMEFNKIIIYYGQ